MKCEKCGSDAKPLEDGSCSQCDWEKKHTRRRRWLVTVEVTEEYIPDPSYIPVSTDDEIARAKVEMHTWDGRPLDARIVKVEPKRHR